MRNQDADNSIDLSYYPSDACVITLTHLQTQAQISLQHSGTWCSESCLETIIKHTHRELAVRTLFGYKERGSSNTHETNNSLLQDLRPYDKCTLLFLSAVQQQSGRVSPPLWQAPERRSLKPQHRSLQKQVKPDLTSGEREIICGTQCLSQQGGRDFGQDMCWMKWALHIDH